MQSNLDYLLEDSAADGHIAGEGALLVNVLTLDGGLRGLEAYKKEKATNAPQLALPVNQRAFGGAIRNDEWAETYRGQFFCRI